MAQISDNGVITYFSFLLFEKKFIAVLITRYIAKNKQIHIAAVYESGSVIIFPTYRIINIANICMIKEIPVAILICLGSTLCAPPSVYSPSGKPKVTSSVRIATKLNSNAPSNAYIMYFYPTNFFSKSIDVRVPA
ncbi:MULTISPECIES: hypothetical protein [unclassified Breznakia]|uniref:hypothetical protein n=1 Tax=unclassified Breznakia TaxID=2623764 RepID=UPI002475C12C|nr:MULTISPECIES: hypothetical protein [unclassified Breznakia]MDH6366412.1 cephalosporin-C deacetylase-like acetyl esterase [Breznakia sp. PH1-1]MDH6403505.1 cephalosporin-C deacetylase-like acetyl esterase [Breznakia sp. PF1-11]MDH6411214.1 cephalosporin-C deacetylase-like acetyl esterase [Breznakia sp. PFB1-11]MDH6413523.1 cephalosporin-C deacetylase-like acetyl esterase [Breznakia sp. PFB1-14]MDH6415759.1 cephalosporin-C deacetylase-like acetyl esterase [Breznakia sp. PFB1-4]